MLNFTLTSYKLRFYQFQIYSVCIEESFLEQFKLKQKKIQDSILNGEFPSTSTVLITLKKDMDTKSERTDWILSTFADTMRLISNHKNFI